MESGLFYVFGTVTLVAAINVVAQRRVFYSAVSLIVCLCALAGIYMLLNAPFIAAVQVIVYAGAIMVLFLFVIMMLDPFSAVLLEDKKRSLGFVGLALGVAALIPILSLLRSYELSSVPRDVVGPQEGFGSIQRIGELLFKEYLLPFEVTSILILVAIIGTVIMAKKSS